MDTLRRFLRAITLHEGAVRFLNSCVEVKLKNFAINQPYGSALWSIDLHHQISVPPKDIAISHVRKSIERLVIAFYRFHLLSPLI